MDWIEKVSKENIFEEKEGYEEELFNLLNFKKRPYKAPKHFITKFTPISQFFLSMSSPSIGEVQNIIVPPTESLFKQAVEEAAFHFKSVELVEKKEVTELRFSIPKEDSLKLLMNSEKNKIIEDIFWRGTCDKVYQPEESSSNTSVYLINLLNVEAFEDKEFDSVFGFYRSVFPSEKDFLIKPRNWLFNDKLKESITLKYFFTHCTKLYIWVDNDLNMVKYIHIKTL